MPPLAASDGKYVLLERGGEAADPGDDRAVDDVDAGIDRPGRALAGRDEGANPIAVQHDPAVPVADDVGAQRHVNAAGVPARETRSRMLKSKNKSPLRSRKRSCSRPAA